MGSGRLQGKVTVVTGGASGMGQATALRWLDEGATVVVGDMNEDNGKATAALAGDAGHADRFHFLRTDVAREDDVVALLDAAVEQGGRLDVVFNNAGVGGAVGPITETSVDDWDYTLGVLLTGVMLGIKHGGRIMKRQGEGGSIINTASVAGVGGGCGPHAYSAAKAAVINLTRTTSSELAADRIRVNAICPGAINTPLINFGNPDAMGQVFDGVQPWPQHGTGADIAAMATFLASDESAFVTGSHILVDGGMIAAGPGFLRSIGGGGMMSGVTGVTKGNTGEESELRNVES
jgi:NAD(P)-dependent dehydrogenase (short-subunit alcohol dehydrogenase family)